MEAYGASPSRLRRFATCGDSFWILRNKTDPTRFRLALSLCHDRYCPSCQSARAARIRANIEDHLQPHPYRLVTLTLRSSSDDLTNQVTRLYASFTLLRRHKSWRTHVTGGVAFLEVTYNHDRHTWHPHLHIVCEGKYYPHASLKADWLAVTGDSDVVDIRLIRDAKIIARYVVSYTTKPCNLHPVHDPDLFIEYIRATTARRTIIPFGTWTKYRLLRPPADPEWALYRHENDLRSKLGRHTPLDDWLLACVLIARLDPTAREFTYDPHAPPTI